MSDSKRIADVLSDLSMDPPEQLPYGPGYGRSITTWLSTKDKERYDRLQQLTRKQFSKKVRQVILELIQAAEAKAS